MPPSLKTRGIVLTLSGNRCAKCRRKLVVDGTDKDAPSQTGAIAHIHAEHPGGPRYEGSLSEEYVNSIENLIVLCSNDHKIVDDQPETFTAEVLREMKRKHEEWVSVSLEAEGEDELNFLLRKTKGKELTDLLDGAHAYILDHDPPENRAEAEKIGDFLQVVHDWGEVWSDILPAQRLTVGFDLQEQMEELERAGLWVFAARTKKKYMGLLMETLVVKIVRSMNPEVVAFDPRELFKQDSEQTSPMEA